MLVVKQHMLLNFSVGLPKKQFVHQATSVNHLQVTSEFLFRMNQLVYQFLLHRGTFRQVWLLARLVQQLQLVAQ